MAITKIGTPELFDFSATNTALQLPTGPTSGTGGRPSNPSTGEWRYNTTLKYVEFWDGGEWRQIDTEAQANPDDFPSQNFNVNTYTGNGGTQTLDAKFNEAANFNGSSSYIEISQTLLGSGTLKTWSTSFWFKTSSSTEQYLNNTAAASSNSGYSVYIKNSGYLTFTTSSGGGGTSEKGLEYQTDLSDGDWHNVVATYTSAGGTNDATLKLYVDGADVTGSCVPINSYSAGSGSTYNSFTIPKIILGRWADFATATAALEGAMDQVRFFNTTLTDAQAIDCYTDETTTTAATLNFPAGAGCIAAYQLDGDASDLSDNYPGAAFNLGYTGFKFTPDLTWIKIRTTYSYDHNLYDTVRGADGQSGARDKVLMSNSNSEQEQGNGDVTILTNSVKLVETNVGSSGQEVNKDGEEFVCWNFKAGGAPTVDNSAGVGQVPTPGSAKIDGSNSSTALTGTIAATRLSANTSAGFSIVSYEGNGLQNATVDSGLQTQSNLVIIKNIDQADAWFVGSTELSTNNFLELNQPTDATNNSDLNYTINAKTIQFTSPSPHDMFNENGENYVMYSFQNINGYQRIDSYSGNGSEYGPIVYTTSDGTATGTDGFEPAFIMVKCTNFGSNTDWAIFDNKRSPGTGNKRRFYLYANSNSDEGNATTLEMNFYSNGFQPIGSDGTHNANGKNYIFLAIATDPYTTTPTVTNSFGITLNDAPANNQPVATTFRPDQTWIKAYNVGSGNPVAWGQYDLLRGSGVSLQSNNTGAEVDYYYHYTGNILAMEFSDNGYITPPSVNNNVNNTSDDYISYFWKLGGTQTINNDGAVTSVVTANVNAGTSMALWTGEGSASNIGHGLGGIPELYIVKSVTGTNSWVVGSPSIPGSGAGGYLVLNDTVEYSTSDIWGTQPDATKYYFNTAAGGNGHQLGNTYISYFFRSIPGYQKVGTYTWNNASSTAGTMVTGLGFTPRFVMIKAITEDANWFVFDSERGATTGTQQRYALYPNKEDSGGQSTSGSQGIGFDAYTGPGTGGFSAIVGADGATTASGGLNKNGEDYIYLAIA